MFRGGPASPPPEVAEPAESRSNRKALYLVGGVVGALVLAGGAFLLLNGSSSSDDSGTVAGSTTNANSQPSTVKPTAPVVVKPATVTVSTRDPFAVLYTAPVAAASPTAPAAPPAGTTGGTTTTPVVTPPTTPPVTLAVLSINTALPGTATITVNGKKYSNTKVGATFGTYYTLYSVFNAQCVGLLYGDQNVPVCLSKPATVTP
jgi:hypothetical protein